MFDAETRGDFGIVSCEEQRGAVRATTDFNGFCQFYSVYFSEDLGKDYYLDRVQKSLFGSQPSIVQTDCVRLLTMAGMLGAEFGYESMLGQFSRHKKNG